MSLAELRQARAAIARLKLPDDLVKTRRLGRSHAGRIDPRATMRVSLAQGGEVFVPRFRERKMKPPPLVFLADISGSMSSYSRMLLHFLHAAANEKGAGGDLAAQARRLRAQLLLPDEHAVAQQLAGLLRAQGVKVLVKPHTRIQFTSVAGH
mgnify:CR=1 FL=1